MNRHIAALLVICIMLSFTVFGVPTATADSWTLPEGTHIYKPGRTMALDFGTLTILDAGFAKKAQSIIQVSTETRTVNGESNTIELRHIGYYTAKDGRALFAFKGLLYNSSDQAIKLESLNPTVSFNEEKPTIMYGYPAVPFGIDEYYTLEPDTDVEIVFACSAPNEMYYGNEDILLEFAGGAIGFQRADLGNYYSIGFTSEDGEESGDLTEVPAVQEEGIIVAKQPHVDEVCAEDVSLGYDSKKDEYRVHVKLRNLTGYPLIYDKLPSVIHVYLQFLDFAGDVLPDGNIDVGSVAKHDYTNLRIGQAGWDDDYKFVSKTVVDNTKWIRAVSYEFSYIGINSDGSTQSVNGTFTEPFVIEISDILPERKDTFEKAPNAKTNSKTPSENGDNWEAIPDELISSEVNEFSLRNGIQFGDSIKTVKSKESIPLTGNSGVLSSGMLKGCRYIWSAEDKISGFDGSAVGFFFDNDQLIDMDYSFEATTDSDLHASRLEAIISGLARKYGTPLPILEDGKCLKICSNVFSYASTMIALYKESELGTWEWIVKVNDDYYVKIDLVSLSYYVTSIAGTKYDMRVGYRMFTLNDWNEAISENDETQEISQEIVDNDL